MYVAHRRTPPGPPCHRNIDPLGFVVEDESPYVEVRSAVADTDDPRMPLSTFRARVVGLIWAIIIPGVNQFFDFRYPSIAITPVCLPSLLYPLC